jgi:lipopolysaccharide biosynthesis regulator YciM
MKKVEHLSIVLPEEILWTLQKCDGYLDLGMLQRAQAEFQNIPAVYHQSREAREILLRMAMEDKNWNKAVQQAQDLIQLFPDDPSYHVQLAYSIRRKDSIAAARSVLLEASRRFKKVAVIPYNLACYECQLGHREQALQYLKRAVKLNASFIQMALDDADLEPIWADLDPDGEF